MPIPVKKKKLQMVVLYGCREQRNVTAMLRFSQGPVEPGGLGAGYIAIAVSDYLAVDALYNH